MPKKKYKDKQSLTLDEVCAMCEDFAHIVEHRRNRARITIRNHGYPVDLRLVRGRYHVIEDGKNGLRTLPDPFSGYSNVQTDYSEYAKRLVKIVDMDGKNVRRVKPEDRSGCDSGPGELTREVLMSVKQRPVRVVSIRVDEEVNYPHGGESTEYRIDVYEIK